MDIERSKKDYPHRERQKNPIQPRRIPKDDQILIDKIFNQPRKEWISPQTGFMGGPISKRTSYELVLWSWLAAVTDTLLLVATSCFFLISFSFLMKTSSLTIVHDFFAQKSLAQAFVQLFIFSSWIYMILMRCFFGFSIGEMSCNIRLGQPHERLQLSYIPRVVIRETIIILTGIIFLPLLSLISGRDLTGSLTGLKLYSLK